MKTVLQFIADMLIKKMERTTDMVTFAKLYDAGMELNEAAFMMFAIELE